MAENIRGDIVTKRGRDIEFGKITSRPCPTCNQFGNIEERMLYIRSSIDNSVTLECPNCTYTEHKPIGEVSEALGEITDIKGRPVSR